MKLSDKVRFGFFTIATLLPITSYAEDTTTGCKGKNCLDAPGTLNIPHVSLASGATSIINTLILIAAVVATLFIIIGGIRYITSDGDSSKTNGAKQTITYAILGLIVAILARVIVGFVLTNSPQ
jgi:hypothetical protein